MGTGTAWAYMGVPSVTPGPLDARDGRSLYAGPRTISTNRSALAEKARAKLVAARSGGVGGGGESGEGASSGQGEASPVDGCSAASWLEAQSL